MSRVASYVVAALTPGFLLLLLGAQLALGLAAAGSWLGTGDDSALTYYHRYAGAFILTVFAACELVLALAACAASSPGESIHTVWLFAAGAAALRAAGMLCAHVLPWFGGREEWAHARLFGLQLGGIMSTTCLLISMAMVARSCRRLGVMSNNLGIAALAGAAGVGAAFLYDLILWPPSLETLSDANRLLEWINSPVMMAGAAVAAVLAAATWPMRGGLVALCWQSYCVAVALTCAGTVFNWLRTVKWIEWPGAAIPMMIWYAAAACYALGPAFHLAAVGAAQGRLAKPGLLGLPGRLN